MFTPADPLPPPPTAAFDAQTGAAVRTFEIHKGRREKESPLLRACCCGNTKISSGVRSCRQEQAARNPLVLKFRLLVSFKDTPFL